MREGQWWVWGLRARVPNEGHRPEQLSPGNTGCEPWGKSSYKTEGFPGAGPDGSVTQKGQWVALTDDRECALG